MAANAQRVDLDAELALLLREQEQFLRQSGAPAAKVVRPGGASAAGSASGREATAQQAQQPRREENEAPAPAAAPVVGRVVERDVIRLDPSSARVAPPVRTQAAGFPSVRRRGESLFGRRQKRSGPSPSPSSSPSPSADRMPVGRRSVGEGPAEQERREINAANAARLAEMSPGEIREAQQELLRSLDPALVAKLMRRNRPAGEVPPRGGAEEEKREAQEEKESPSTAIDLAAITTEEQLRASARLLPPEERAKLEWMQAAPRSHAPPPRARASPQGAGERAATLERFDLDGRELPSDAQARAAVPAHSGLFHHGDEPDAPGYTLPELLLLARSSVASQRAMALAVVAKVLARRQRQPRARASPRVLPRELPVAVRVALDDQNYSALGAAVAALHALVVPAAWADEREREGEDEAAREPLPHSSAFELAFGAVLPAARVRLHPDASDQADEHEGEGDAEVVYYMDGEPGEGEGGEGSASDEAVAAADPAQGLLRMGLCARARFLLLERGRLPDERAAARLLDVLAALARHSPLAARRIAGDARLVQAVLRRFLSPERVAALAAAEALDADEERALRLARRALALLRLLSQGDRAAAAALVACGAAQSAKGFLALRGSGGGGGGGAWLAGLQTESLRLWRVLLGYALDVHSLAYLSPLLRGFSGAELVGRGPQGAGAARGLLAAPETSAALFAALEAFCGLAHDRDAQHYFGQLDGFLDLAADRLADADAALREEPAPDEARAVAAAAALRFLAAAAALAAKFRLDARAFARAARSAAALVADGSAAARSLPRTPGTRGLLLAVVAFRRRAARAELLPDEAAAAGRPSARLLLLAAEAAAAEAAAEAAAAEPSATAQACALAVAAADAAARADEREDGGDGAVVAADEAAQLFALGLALARRLRAGMEFWLRRLFSALLFRRPVLRALGLLGDGGGDAEGLRRALAPLYLALVSSSREQEAHSAALFAGPAGLGDGGGDGGDGLALAPSAKASCHLRLPRPEREREDAAATGAGLPLPRLWLYCPLSRVEYGSPGASAEVALVVAAACRFLLLLETRWRPRTAAVEAVEADAAAEAEDKLFHVLHAFFAGSDVLFDARAAAALGPLLSTVAAPLLLEARDEPPRRLYAALARNLRRSRPDESSAVEPLAAASAEQLVLSFAERLAAEFSAASFGHALFARAVALLLAADFPPAVRAAVWRELLAARLLHALAPLDCAGDGGAAAFRRCARGAEHCDAPLLRLMAAAVAQSHAQAVGPELSPERGRFAFALAVQHLAVYLFAGPAPLSAARQELARELLAAPPSAAPRLWRCLLGCELDAAEAPRAGGSDQFLRLGGVSSERAARVQAALREDQRAAFEAIVAQAQAIAGSE